MPEPGFEFTLERMFAEAPSLADAELFALQVLSRLDRGWNTRRLLIGVMGVLGGLLGGAEILSTGAAGQLVWLTGQFNDFLVRHVSDALAPTGVSVDTPTLWMVGALALVGAGLGVARLVREI